MKDTKELLDEIVGAKTNVEQVRVLISELANDLDNITLPKEMSKKAWRDIDETVETICNDEDFSVFGVDKTLNEFRRRTLEVFDLSDKEVQNVLSRFIALIKIINELNETNEEIVSTLKKQVEELKIKVESIKEE